MSVYLTELQNKINKKKLSNTKKFYQRNLFIYSKGKHIQSFIIWYQCIRIWKNKLSCQTKKDSFKNKSLSLKKKITSKHMKYIGQGCINFPKFWGPPQKF